MVIPKCHKLTVSATKERHFSVRSALQLCCVFLTLAFTLRSSSRYVMFHLGVLEDLVSKTLHTRYLIFRESGKSSMFIEAKIRIICDSDKKHITTNTLLNPDSDN